MKKCVLLFAFLLCLSVIANAKDYYKFDSSWPVNAKGMYFQSLSGIIADDDENVYVLDKIDNHVYKYSRKGYLLSSFSPEKMGLTGELKSISIMGKSIYLLMGNEIILLDAAFNKLSSYSLLAKFNNCYWVSKVEEKLYVACGNNNNLSIATFSGELDFISVITPPYNGDASKVKQITTIKEYMYFSDREKLFSYNTATNELRDVLTSVAGLESTDITATFVDESKFYVLYRSNDKIAIKIIDYAKSLHNTYELFDSKLDNDRAWQLNESDMFVDDNYIYISNNATLTIKKFNKNNMSLVDSWGDRVDLDDPSDILLSKKGEIVLLNNIKNAIDVYDKKGVLLKSIKQKSPYAIDQDVFGNYHVMINDVSSNAKDILKYDNNFNFISSFDVVFGMIGCVDPLAALLAPSYPTGLTIADNMIYFGYGLASFCKTSLDYQEEYGQYLPIHESGGILNESRHMSSDGSNAFVPINNSIYKIKPDLSYEKTLSNLNRPHDVEYLNGKLLVANTGNSSIDIFDEYGGAIDKIGSFGSLPTQLKMPEGIESDDNFLYIADTGNNRVVLYRKVDRPDRSKVVLIAGGDQSGNPLWDETQANANHAFWSLANQGYTKENIQYMTHNTNLDLDGNGKPDDVDGRPTRANVKAALTQWAKDAEDVVLYMVGHGGNGTFQLGGGEILTAAELNGWLNELQAVMPGKVTVIYDACESGSFQKPFSGSPYPRTVITSTSAKTLESAYFQDAISFSHLFWNEVFSGKTVSEAFQTTQTSISQAFGSQSPQMDSDGDGITNTANDYNVVAQQVIGNGTVYSGTAPTIGSLGLTPVGKGESTSTITAYNVSDDKGVQSVWGIVRPPYANLTTNGLPVQNLPRFDLVRQSDGSYQGQFDGFEQPGAYQIILYAQDQEGNVSMPVVETLNVISPMGRKAVLVAGVDGTGQFTQDIKAQTDHAHSALIGQDYSGSSIEYLSASSVATAGVDRAASKDGLEFVLTEWAADATSDLVVYLVGDITNGQYRVSATESLSLTELDQWLDQVQAKIKGTLTVIHEGNYAGNLVAQLTTPGNASRIVISSSALDQGSYVMGSGNVSFSRYFWSKVAQGGNVADAFMAGEASMRRYQTPQINSNGNAVSNEKDDRYQARFHNVGIGTLLAADEPVIGDIPANASLSGSTHSTLWAEEVISSLSALKQVWAVVEPPDYDPANKQTGNLVEVALQPMGNGRWQADFTGFSKAGVYAVHYYVMDANDRISAPRTSYVNQTRGADAYEDDSSFGMANYLPSTTGQQQWHNFHHPDDIDYIRFDADPSQGQYTLKVDTQGSAVDAGFALYDANYAPIVLGVGNQNTIDGVPGDSVELAYWLPPTKGSYYLKVYSADSSSTGIAGGYKVSVFPTNAPQDAVVTGVVKNVAGSPVVGAKVYSSSNHQATTDTNGHYSLPLKQGENSLTVEASGYENNTLQLTVRAEDSLVQDFALLLVDGNGKPEANSSNLEIPMVQAGTLPTTTVAAGHSGQVVMHVLKVTAPASGAELRQLKLKGSGTGNEASDIKAVRLYHDVNSNHQVDGGDVQLGQVQAFTADNGQVTFRVDAPYLLTQGQHDILVCYEFQ